MNYHKKYPERYKLKHYYWLSLGDEITICTFFLYLSVLFVFSNKSTEQFLLKMGIKPEQLG